MHRTLILFAALAVACGGSKPETTDPGTGAATGDTATGDTATGDTATGDTATGGQINWAEMSLKDKKSHMKKVVLPAMAELFKSHDPEEYSDVKCTLCHGEGAMTGDFEMPNDQLPKLNPANGFEAHRAEHADDLEFMSKQVVPKMSELLGVEPYNPETQSGFGCFNCHTMAGQ